MQNFLSKLKLYRKWIYASVTMGCGDSRVTLSPVSTYTDDSNFPTCDPCINRDVIAKGWCGQCHVYLCSACIKSHVANHKIAKGKWLPKKRPKPESLTNNVAVKQVIPNSTLEDMELKAEDLLMQERSVRGCVSIEGFIVAIMHQKLRLYDLNFMCIQHLDLPNLSPNTICSHGHNMVVSFDRPTIDMDSINMYSTSKKKSKKDQFKDILSFVFSLKGSSKAKVTKGGGFETEGECFTVAMCPLYDKQPLLAAGMTVEYHPHRDDLFFQVQILDTKGKIKQVLVINPRGEPCFEGRFFLSTTLTFDEIVISDIKERKVRGISMRTGKTVYEFGSGHPQGLTVDNLDNIYIFNDGALYWIPPHRNKIFYMHQQPGKKTKKSEVTQKTVAVSFDNATRIVYVTNVNKSNIETFRIT